MSIDWITVGAQIVNFLVLVWLLKRFLYRPILDGIDAREAEIVARMGEAAEIEAAADRQKAEYERKIAEISANRADFLDRARQEAEQERREMLEAARKKIEAEVDERAERRADEARDFQRALEKKGAEALVSLTRKALHDLADETLEHRLVSRAATRLMEVEDQLDGTAREIVAQTRDPMPEETRADLRAALASVAPGAELRFETDPGKPYGLSLKLGSVQVDWTIDDYLEDFETLLEDVASPIPAGKEYANV